MKIANKVCMMLCDDIREEKANKLSFLGVYGIENSGIIPSQIPLILPKLCLAVMLGEVTTEIKKIDVQLSSPGSQDFHMTLPAPLANPSDSNITLGVIISPYRIEGVGDAKFQLRINDETKPSIVFPFKILPVPPASS